jgi:hypothetical protein
VTVLRTERVVNAQGEVVQVVTYVIGEASSRVLRVTS